MDQTISESVDNGVPDSGADVDLKWKRCTALLTLATAALTVVSTALGLWAVAVQGERDELATERGELAGTVESQEDSQQSLSDENEQLESDLDTARTEVRELEAALNEQRSTATTEGTARAGDTFLTELTPIEGETVNGSRAVEGDVYEHSIIHGDLDAYCDESSVEYDLSDGNYQSFQALAGVADDSSQYFEVDVEIRLDDREPMQRTVSLYHSEPFDLDVNGVRRLTLRAVSSDCSSETGEAVWGDARLTAE